MTKGKIYLIGFGPGDYDNMTHRAVNAIKECEVIVGYKTYINLIKPQLEGKEVITTGMQGEVERAQIAVEKAITGNTVAVVSSGDAGIYGMAGLVYEILKANEPPEEKFPDIETIPGITALNGVASILGAPLMHDFVGISLSDLLTPWEIIEKRVNLAGEGDFVIALYNPQSKKRDWQLEKTRDILLQYRNPKTPVGVVKSAYRKNENIDIVTLQTMCEVEVGMLTTIIIGNSTSYVYRNKIITPRGYHTKYDLTSE
ncbi:MAG: precorrin-3B C(17)-methyltransferase [Nitrospinae bacterium]|nr:precorrin-3B C(17)-methyltransferase [Nitrospinota bacterium]